MTAPAWRQFLAAGVLALAAAIALASSHGQSRGVTPGLVKHLESRFGGAARDRIEGWRAFMRAASASTGEPRAALDAVNAFWNRLHPDTDLSLWGVEEYWATPAETLAVNGADCEDYALAKYFALRELGMPVGRLRLVYARTENTSVAHMVLAYYADPRADPLILDNLDGRIAAASARTDLTPVYMFNDEDLYYLQQGASTVRLDPAVHRKWKEYLGKLERELAL